MKEKLIAALRKIGQSFGAKVFLRLTILISIITTSFTAVFLYEQGRTLKQGIRSEGEIFAQLVAHSVRLGVFSEDTTLIEDVIRTYLENKKILSVTAFNSDGKLLVKEDRPRSASAENPPHDDSQVPSILKELRETHPQYYHRDSLKTFEIWAPVVSGLSYANEQSMFFAEAQPDINRTIGYVRVVFDKSQLKRQLSVLLAKGIFMCLVFLVCVPAVFYVMVIKATRPLNKLTESVRAIEEGSTVEPLRVETNDEIGKLALAFNEMADSLKKKETEKQHLEAQLRHAQKMEAIGQLAGGVAHDFNNILNVIMGYGSMVLDSIEPASPLKGHMNEVLAAADRAANLTKRLLAFSRKQVVEMKPVNVNETIRGIEKMLSRIIGEDIVFATELTGKKMTVIADSGQIEQVLMNLASNARDAMPKGGRLTISTGIKVIDDEYIAAYGYGKTGTYSLISVTDTGIGIDAETKRRIFEPFFTTKGFGEGTGLGLAIAYGIIKQHNGYIQVYSEEGKGSTFKILLPLIEEETLRGQEVEAVDAIKGGTETILVAEDDASLRELTRLILESFGYRVIIAVDGDDAITKYMGNKDKIKLVILDMIMPKKSGKEAYNEIRKVDPSIKTLFVSGYTMDSISREELLNEGMDFILKPITPKDLLKEVREVLER